jgi:hypothetical protein
MKSWLSVIASSCARVMARFAVSVNMSNTSVLLALRLAPARMLFVHRLTADLQCVSDALPRPALVAGTVDVQPFQLVEQAAERDYGTQSDGGIFVGQLPRQRGWCVLSCHAVRLT